MTENAAPYGDQSTCPVCGGQLRVSWIDEMLDCKTGYCPLFNAGLNKSAWRFLCAAIDQQSDAVQEARKVIARMAARGGNERQKT